MRSCLPCWNQTGVPRGLFMVPRLSRRSGNPKPFWCGYTLCQQIHGAPNRSFSPQRESRAHLVRVHGYANKYTTPPNRSFSLRRESRAHLVRLYDYANKYTTPPNRSFSPQPESRAHLARVHGYANKYTTPPNRSFAPQRERRGKMKRP